MEAGLPLLDAYALDLARTRSPRLLFLPTAGGDPADQIGRFERVFGSLPCRPRVLSLFHRADLEEPLEDVVLAQDVIYVGGGSMVNLLALWHAHGLPDLLREAHRRGTVLAGLSAGAMCWMDGGVTRSQGAPSVVDGLGLVGGSLSVHAHRDPERGRALRAAIAAGRLPGGWTADDHAGLLFVDGRLRECVAGRPDAKVHRIDRGPDGTLVERELPVRRLGPQERWGWAADEPGPSDRGGLRDELRLVRRMRAARMASGPGRRRRPAR